MISASEKLYATNFERAIAAAGLAAIGGGAFVVSFFNPTTAGFFPVCPLYKFTGIACPGCGLTRAFHALLHGDFTTALGFNALVPFFLLLFVYFLVSMVLVAWRGRGLSANFYRPWMLWAIAVLFVLFAVLRNLPFYPFTLLYP